MIQRSENSKQCRQYFIAVKEQFNNPQDIMARALRVAGEELKRLHITVSQLTVDNQIMKPKAKYFDELVDRNLLTSFRETAKQFGIKEKAFIQFLMDKKYIYRDKKVKKIDDPLINAYRFQVLTGLRPGELIGLQWDDIKERYRTFTQSHKRVQRGHKRKE